MTARTIRQPNGCWSVTVGALGVIVVLRDESYQVAANVAHALETGAAGASECAEVARAILQRVEKKA
jgi:hypothetical protein